MPKNRYSIDIPKDTIHIKTYNKLLNSLGIFLAMYSRTTPAIDMMTIINRVLRYGAGFTKASEGGTVGSGSSRGVINGLSGLTLRECTIYEKNHVKHIVNRTGT
ncbi:MAG: hypothetical protein QW724_07715 [Nitrososphaerota archaeon]